jgi:hypothetical protein
VTEVPDVADKLPQVDVCAAIVDRDAALTERRAILDVPADEPDMFQFKVASPLASFPIEDDRVRAAPLAVAACVVLSAPGNTMEIALTVSASVLVLVESLMEVAVMVAVQSLFSEDSSGAV